MHSQFYRLAELKRDLRRRLRDAQVSPRAMTALYTGLLLVLDLVILLGSGYGVLSMFIRILCWLISMVLGAGFVLYCMAIRRGERSEYLTLFDGFSFAGRLIALNLLISLLIVLWSMLFVIPGIIAIYRYRFALFYFYENPDIGILEAITLSRQQTQGRKWQLFCLDLSFLGWTLLASVPTLIQNFLYYSAAFRMLSDCLSSPSGVLMMPDASVLLLPGWAWTLITGAWIVVVAMFYLPHYYCAQLTLFEEAKSASSFRQSPDGLGGL